MRTRSRSQPRAVPCEACGREPAYSFSWFADPADWYGERSGTWRITGNCTADSEQYYVLFRRRGRDGFLDSAAAQAEWIAHLREKVWFNIWDFTAMLDRFVEAGGSLRTAGPRRRLVKP